MGKDVQPLQSVNKTGILVVLTDMSDLGDIYIKDDDAYYVLS
jgi:hypothetical protein